MSRRQASPIFGCRVLVPCFLCLCCIVYGGCGSAAHSSGPIVTLGEEKDEYAHIRRTLSGNCGSLVLGNMQLQELPSSFDLNPDLTEDRETRKETGFPHIRKKITVDICDFAIGEQYCRVRTTPGRAEDGKPFLYSSIKIYKQATWRVADDYHSFYIEPKNDRDLVVKSIGVDGSLSEGIAHNWVTVIVLDGKGNGLVAWSTNVMHTNIEPAKSGYRLFRVEAGRDTQGWRTLLPYLCDHQ